MTNLNKNAEMENGMFNAAQLKNETIIVNNGTITFYHRVHTEHGTEWLSFDVNCELHLKEVVKIMHHNLSMGVDLIVDGAFFGYFKWSNNFEHGCVGYKLYNKDGMKIGEHETNYKRYCENAEYTVAVYMYNCIMQYFIDPVDAAVAEWGKKNPEKYDTIEYNTENEYFNVWVGEFFFQMDEKLTGDWYDDYENVLFYLEDTLEGELGSALECESGEIVYNESWDEALELTEKYMTLSDAWELGFTVETFLGEWAGNNIDRILSDDWRNLGDPSPFRVPVELDGKTEKYDYPADDFRGDVRYYINTIVEKTLKNPDRYTSIIADYLYDTWNDNFSIFFTGRYRYDEYEGVIYDDEYREPTEEEKRRAADIADYCRNYGYDFACAYFECHDTDTADDTVLLPMMGGAPDDFYDTFGEDAMWDDEAMYLGMADYLNEGDERRWRVECDGYRVYGYTIDPVDADDSDENDIMEETNDMYQYASEAAEEIENLADSVNDAYSDIIAEMKNDEPDIEYAMGRVDDMYRNLKDIENELKCCLHRCDERTGCDIGWDDFCTADYFEPIKIHGDWDCPSYSIAEFINDYNSDAADFMNTLIENIWKALGGQNGDTFRNAIADSDMPFYIAA